MLGFFVRWRLVQKSIPLLFLFWRTNMPILSENYRYCEEGLSLLLMVPRKVWSFFGLWKKVSLVFLFVAQESRYGHCVLLNLRRRSACHHRGKKVQYLGLWAINWKNKDTLPSQTLKVKEKKVSFVFLFKALEPRYGHNLIFHIIFPFDATIW